ncbi:16S rRNA (uracil(1498)-N(3))-methyltransferase [Azospira inquinata]|uniref:Ribosomal RNA small subunit methyltransferase E n=1 Tax=Azospira inquinata TaxID=2785627 RepID=A0A975XVE1_9RHOO|nr:16S rRNA (uracil(1498)-N(3))-methyltransferase [Azospira inquinata]QWT44939.1 16S rRNA (uracil(1498)-N(3))-methyltransferase [Azospira inquinata]QWT49729.1 16S rRNA (uracil(1498)-N(3))-methyltransferase [Azospira inquinata]
MNAPRFFCPLPLSQGALVALPPFAARHAVRVLRLAEGDCLTLFNGEGGEYLGVIQSTGKDQVQVRLEDYQAVERESLLDLVLVQAVQGADKMDFTVQKAVELGVSRFQPVASRRSVVRLAGERADKRVEHWRGVAVSACEQCGRNRVPAVEGVLTLEKYLARPAAPDTLRLVLSPGGATALCQLPRPQGAVELLVGAEGGLAPEEVAQAQGAGFLPLVLGPRVLRTETAGLAALAAIHALWGDFGGSSDV